MMPELERVLPTVQKPARYTGGEFNQIVKDKSAVDLRFAFCFPDTYEVGMSNLGMRILYGALNEEPGVWCERVFAPWGDMEDAMRASHIPLYALESGDPIRDFDMIAFSVGYEMAFTNVLNMLDLAGLPIRAAERTALTPIVAAGGTVGVNPEPMADFVDLFFVGEGEDVDLEVVRLLKKAKAAGWDKQTFLAAAAGIEGVYVPSLYEPVYRADGTLQEMKRASGAPERVTKRIVERMDEAYYPVKTIVPSTEIIHDRVVLELFRGCIRGCRFCQAGFIYRPVRRRSPEALVKIAEEALADSGYEEITLSSLSSSDYKGLGELCDGLLDWCEPRKISLSLPSLRADNFSMGLMERVQKVRKTGLTFAPEAGTQRLRDVINKNVREEDVLNACRIAFEGGWSTLKLYFMLGLPTETDEDVLGIADLANKVVHEWREHASNKNRGLRITVSTSCFIPKPFTPFQWEGQISREEYMRRVTLLRDNLRARCVTYNWHDADTSLVEAVLSRGDRRIGRVIENVWRAGGKLDAWSEYFSFDRWMQAMADAGVDPAFYACRERSTDEVLPWDVISVGVDKAFFIREREAAYRGVVTRDCRAGCSGCGADRLMTKGGRCDG